MRPSEGTRVWRKGLHSKNLHPRPHSVRATYGRDQRQRVTRTGQRYPRH